jgi:hypothetical protein
MTVSLRAGALAAAALSLAVAAGAQTTDPALVAKPAPSTTR